MKISTILLILLLCSFGSKVVGQSWENIPYPRWSEFLTAMDATGDALWLAVENKGIYRYDLNQERVTDSFPIGRIRYHALVPGGGIWTWWHDNTLTFSEQGEQRSWQIPVEMNVAYPVTDSTGWIGNGRNFFWFDGQGLRDSMGLGSAGFGPEQTVLAGTDGQLWVQTPTALLAYLPGGADTLYFADMPMAVPGQRPWILPGTNGDLWLLFFPNDTSYHLLTYHPQRGFTAYPNQPKSRWGARFQIDHANRLWVEQSNTQRRWTPGGLVDERVLPPLNTNQRMGYPDTDGNIWQVGRFQNGNAWVVCRTDLANDSHFRMVLNQGPSSYHIRHFWSDAQGRQYFFDGNGFISRFDPRSQGWDLLFTDLWDSNLYSDWDALAIKQDPSNGSLVILSQVEQGPWRDETQRLERFYPEEDRWELIESDPWVEIQDFAISPQGVIAIRTRLEGYQIHRDGEFVPVGFPPRLQEQGVIQYMGMRFDRQERLWIALKNIHWQSSGTPDTYRQYVYDPTYNEWTEATDGITRPYPNFGWNHFLFPDNNNRYFLADSAMLVQWNEAGRAYMQLIRPADFGLEKGEHFVAADLDAQQNVWLATSRYRLIRYSCAGIISEAIPGGSPWPDLRLVAFHIGTDGRIFLAPVDDFVYQVFEPGENADCAPDTEKPVNQWQINPQPVTNFLVLSHPDSQAAELELRWLDLSGREVLREKVPFRFPHTRLSLNPRLSSGLYLLQIISGAESDWRKVQVVR